MILSKEALPRRMSFLSWAVLLFMYFILHLWYNFYSILERLITQYERFLWQRD